MKATDHGRLSPSLRHHAFADGQQLAAALATRVATTLQEAIKARGEARLAVSGGSTPKRFFEALSEQEIDWDRVIVTLIDERLVPPENERSNHGLANRHLLKNKAARARFIPLYAEADDAEAAARIAATRIDGLDGPLDVAVLGMGTDGHTASFFPGGSTLAEATDPDCPMSVIAMEAPGAGEPRLTLTLPRIVEAGLVVLHIEGTEKKAVLAEALQPGPDADIPVRSVLRDAAEPVEIYWAP
ncbi:6-phosphogluconolactonase [Hoeflea sp.]|uniref:6-phosphogluconolactonase n=1 Tax=Hoeflea sp. TaxID=1940281 RepID=UPI003BB15FAE